MKSTLIIKRIKQSHLKGESFTLFIDKLEICNLYTGNERKFNISSGVHHVCIQNEMHTVEIEQLSLKPGEICRLECGSN